MMTGMCMMVSEAPPNQGRYPRGVMAMTAETAPRAPETTIRLTLDRSISTSELRYTPRRAVASGPVS
jgi:hypothetical protein